MALFNKQGGAEARAFREQHQATLAILVDLETRHLLEAAIKFMTRERRDRLEVGDLEDAMHELHHSSLLLDGHQSHG